MQGRKEDEVESDGEEFKLPPVQFLRKPATSVKTVKDQLITMTNNFKEEKIQVQQSAIQCLEFLSQGTFLAAGCSSGVVRILSTSQGNTQFILKGDDHSPVTGLASNSNSTTLKHALMVTHSGGTLQYWHATSRQLLFSKNYNQMLQTCEISPLGTHYAFAGELGKIRIGHLNKGEAFEVQSGHLGNHQNRIFCLKWNPDDNNMLASGGWDRAVHFWDIRLKTSTKKIFGSYIGAEAIDFRGFQILLGNNKPENQLRIYDIKADKVRSIPWGISQQIQSHYTTGVLSCYFTPDNEIIACTPKNQVRLYENDKCVSEYSNREQQLRLYCMSRYGGERRVVTGWNDGSIRWLGY